MIFIVCFYDFFLHFGKLSLTKFKLNLIEKYFYKINFYLPKVNFLSAPREICPTIYVHSYEKLSNPTSE